MAQTVEQAPTNVGFGSWLCGNVRRSFAETGVGGRPVSSGPLDPVFPISGISTVLVTLSAPEGRYEPKMAPFRVKKAPIYALIAAISGRMPRMFMTRVRACPGPDPGL